MELSVVAVVIDNLTQTQRFVTSIRDYTKGKYELILIDNGSTDKKTIAYLKKVADKYFRFSETTDLSKAWNKGIELSKGTYVAIANNDVVVPPNWFPLLKEIFSQRKRAGMVYPLTYWTLDRCLRMGWIRNLKTPIKIPRWKQGVWGEFNLFPRKILQEVGGFSEEYPGASGEDLDMLYNLHDKNYGVYIQPKVFVFHEGGATGKQIPKAKLDEMYEKNWRIFLKKWNAYKEEIYDRR